MHVLLMKSNSFGMKELTISKSAMKYDRVKLGQKRPGWKYLTREVRAQIDDVADPPPQVGYDGLADTVG